MPLNVLLLLLVNFGYERPTKCPIPNHRASIRLFVCMQNKFDVGRFHWTLYIKSVCMCVHACAHFCWIAVCIVYHSECWDLNKQNRQIPIALTFFSKNKAAKINNSNKIGTTVKSVRTHDELYWINTSIDGIHMCVSMHFICETREKKERKINNIKI